MGLRRGTLIILTYGQNFSPRRVEELCLYQGPEIFRRGWWHTLYLFDFGRILDGLLGSSVSSLVHPFPFHFQFQFHFSYSLFFVLFRLLDSCSGTWLHEIMTMRWMDAITMSPRYPGWRLDGFYLSISNLISLYEPLTNWICAVAEVCRGKLPLAYMLGQST